MLSKNQIKFVNSLKQKKFRQEHNLFLAEGTKTILELLQSTITVTQIYATQKFLNQNQLQTTAQIIETKENELQRITSLTTPSQVLAVCQIPTYQLNQTNLKEKLTIVLDDIKDPGNLGTIIRIADWFGIDTIICSPQTADCFNPKVVQATMGSIARIQIHYLDLPPFLQKMKEEKLMIAGAILQGENIYQKQLPENALIVIGNEAQGITETISQFITDKISIPSYSHYKSTDGEPESLNAAIATSIICSEFRRRKN